jgi:hypothetical protein
MHNDIGPVILGTLSVVFAGYGIRELTLAYKVAALKEWCEKAAQGADGVFVAMIFAGMTLSIIN